VVVAGPAVAGSPSKRRQTRHVTLRQANNLVAACAFAELIGCRLNVSIDICWLMFSGRLEDATRFAKSRHRFSKWCARQGFGLTMIWVREIGANGALHTHILMHVPPWLMEEGEFQSAFERSFEPEGGPTHEKAILVKHAYSPEGKLRYMLKGMRRADATTLKVRASFQGEVEGKRVGCTENIGPRARARRDAATKLGRGGEYKPPPNGSISSEFETNSHGVEACPLHTQYEA
jgi:hypothetical protein